eukprot:scaffold176_cov103-Phaeocystis_antarctica.AAC.1
MAVHPGRPCLPDDRASLQDRLRVHGVHGVPRDRAHRELALNDGPEGDHRRCGAGQCQHLARGTVPRAPQLGQPGPRQRRRHAVATAVLPRPRGRLLAAAATRAAAAAARATAAAVRVTAAAVRVTAAAVY